MIAGIGIDIVEIDRMSKIINRWGVKFSDKIFTNLEIDYCKRKKKDGYQSFSGRFAAKEAFLKALGTGLRGNRWKDIEIKNNHLGKPEIKLKGRLKDIISEKNIKKIFLTISHSGKYAIAQVILEK